ncbi:hypothetical protein [Zoogloea sp.]|uniref:hypothetical protein n=1 Tax=Zoogloea sp. TaxID=49181 RepID=UPI0026086ABF|nr:hypothetical protein [Zoogloea sp.]
MTKIWMQRLVFVTALLFILGGVGCQTLQPDAVRQQVKGKSVAVTSLLGPRLNLQLIGTTIFHNQYGTLTVPEWGLDEFAISVVRSSMKNSGSYADVSVFYGASRNNSDGSLILPEGTQADFIVAIDSWSHRDPIFNTNAEVKGLGVFHRTFFGALNKTFVFAGLQVSLHDSSGKLIGQHPEVAYQEAPFTMRSGGDINWDWNGRNPAPIIEQADMASLKEIVRLLLRKTVEKGLDDSGLR